MMYKPSEEKYSNLKKDDRCSSVGQIIKTEEGETIICSGPGQGYLEGFQGYKCPPEMKKKNLC